MSAPSAPSDIFDIREYLERVGLSAGDLEKHAPRSSALLHQIMWAQATHIPWENLSNVDPARLRVLHPSSEAAVREAEHDVPVKLRTSIDPNDIYYKMVSKRRGGYCYEHNLLLGRALRELGFDVKLIAGRGVSRVGSPDPTHGFSLAASTHLVLIASADDGDRFLVDDGYIWAGAPRTPLRLAHAEETIDPATGEVFRLICAPAQPTIKPGFAMWGNYARASGAPGLLSKHNAGSGTGWFLQYKPAIDADEFWDMFHFDETDETTITDCLTGAWYASTSPYHRQPHMSLAAIMTSTGRISLVNDRLTVRERGQIVSETVLSNEHEITSALERHFGIV